MIRLFTSFYNEPNEARRQELVQCLTYNLNESAIDEVCLFVENTEAPLTRNNLTIRPLAERPLYKDLFDWAGEFQQADDLAVVCNSDIYFDESLAGLEKLMGSDQCVALSRWHVCANGQAELFDRSDSQDSWIFRGPLRSIVADYPIGVTRCDNRMLYELKQAGYQVINPAFSVKSFHLHAGDERPYDYDSPDMVQGPYSYHWPHNLVNLPGTILHNIRCPKARIHWRFDHRRFMNSLPFRIMTKPFRMVFPSKEQAEN